MEGTTDVDEYTPSDFYVLDSFGQCCGSDETYEDTENNIWIYASPLLIILGTVGNVLSGRVMLGKRLRKHTTSVYLIALAVVDTFILYSNMPGVALDQCCIQNLCCNFVSCILQNLHIYHLL